MGEKFTLQQLSMLQLPPYQYSVVIGLLLSDGWLNLGNARAKNARLGFKQSPPGAPPTPLVGTG